MWLRVYFDYETWLLEGDKMDCGMGFAAKPLSPISIVSWTRRALQHLEQAPVLASILRLPPEAKTRYYRGLSNYQYCCGELLRMITVEYTTKPSSNF